MDLNYQTIKALHAKEYLMWLTYVPGHQEYDPDHCTFADYY